MRIVDSVSWTASPLTSTFITWPVKANGGMQSSITGAPVDKVSEVQVTLPR